MEPAEEHRTPPVAPYPVARRERAEQPMRIPSSTATRTWTVIGLVLLAALLLFVVAVALYVAFGIQDRA